MKATFSPKELPPVQFELRTTSPVEVEGDLLVTYSYVPPTEPPGSPAEADERPKERAAKGKGGRKAKEQEGPDGWSTSPTLDAIDGSLEGALRQQAQHEEFKSKPNSTLLLHTVGRLPVRTVLVIGMGEKRSVKAHAYRSYAARAARTAQAERARTLVLLAPDSEDDTLRTLAEGVELGAYRFTRYLTGDRQPKVSLERVIIVVERAPAGTSSGALTLGQSIGRAVNVTRDLVSEPPNILDAPALAEAAEQIATANGLEIKVFDKKEITARGMNLLLAVNQGSTIEPRFVHMTYRPRGAKKGAVKRMVFVGKGLTFDSGGLCIKTAEGMLDMKTDMTGAANVIGLMAAVAAVKPKVEVHGIFAATDNMPSGSAYHPSDVFASLDGKSVEIINTDAEGRLVLADALAYARELEPDIIVDNATLTGACMVALGPYCSGFYASTDELATEFAAAVDTAGELMWRLPLLEELRDQLKSEIADLKHTGSRYGGSITAALFLREFAGGLPWIHCDIAGPATIDKPMGFYNKGATGHGVLSFLKFIEQYARR